MVKVYRTHNCGQLSKKDIGKKVILSGWVDSLRAHGKIGFINIRDRYGKIQLFLEGNEAKKIPSFSNESVIRIEGRVNKRPAKLVNKNMKTGEIEVKVSKLEILSRADQLPLQLNDYINTTEDTRLKYRYLDLRTEKLQKNLKVRHDIIKAIRDFLDKQGFIDVETPILLKSTPEGARDYLVPSRVHKGKFFALPQSPQLLKQLLMVAGYDKYFQIARCFRDEDLRADRQPEFTQLDLEMSFVNEKDIYDIIEGTKKYVWKVILKENIKIPFPRMTYKEAMSKYKTDKPDLRKKPGEWRFVWIIDFPLLEYSEEEKKYNAMHHPFTSPKGEDVKLLDKKPEKARARAYDLVLNGIEIGGGSIRIHNRELQEKMFRVLKITEAEAKRKFGFLLDAFGYGAPSHGGIALGLDRLIMLIAGEDTIREVIAFPKNKDAKDLMLNSPSEVDKKQLDELGIKLKKS